MPTKIIFKKNINFNLLLNMGITWEDVTKKRIKIEFPNNRLELYFFKEFYNFLKKKKEPKEEKIEVNLFEDFWLVKYEFFIEKEKLKNLKEILKNSTKKFYLKKGKGKYLLEMIFSSSDFSKNNIFYLNFLLKKVTKKIKKIDFEGKKIILFPNKIEIPILEFKKLLGEKNLEKIKFFLKKNKFKYSTTLKKIKLIIPNYRKDIVSFQDVIGEYYRFFFKTRKNKKIKFLKIHSEEKKEKKLIDLLFQNGFREVCTFTISEKKKFEKFNLEENKFLTISNPSSLKKNIIRNCLFPSHFENIIENNKDFPKSKIFEIDFINLEKGFYKKICFSVLDENFSFNKLVEFCSKILQKIYRILIKIKLKGNLKFEIINKKNNKIGYCGIEIIKNKKIKFFEIFLRKWPSPVRL